MDIFNDEYVKKEIDFMDLPSSGYEHLGTKLKWMEAGLRLDDYLNVNMRVDTLRIPVIGDASAPLWMSLTPMEVQSAHVAIERAKHHERIALGGLGLGYAALKMAALPNVQEVDVFEINPATVDMFKQLHSHREEFKKINFIIGDVRETLQGLDYSYVWMDIYATLASDEMRDDIAYFIDSNSIDEYRYWGQELMLYLYFSSKEVLPIELTTQEDREFFSAFIYHGQSNLRPPVSDYGFAESAIQSHIERV